MYMTKLLLGFLVTAALTFPAPIEIGVKGGVPITDSFETNGGPDVNFDSETRRFVVGPVLGINLPLGLGLEFNALYRRLGYDVTEDRVNVIVLRSTTANAWDFPALLKLRLAPGPVKPYVSIGPTFRYVSGIDEVRGFFTGQTQSTEETDQPPELQNRFSTGFTLAGGVQLGLGPLKLSPELRYIRWGWENFRSPGTAFRSNQNDVLVLLGFTF
jgi:opacity protein-like surface antigen